MIKLTGKTVDVMYEVNTSYNNFISLEKGKRVLYLKLKKALYGCIQSEIMWYDTFKGCLEKMVFKLNKYDPCVANKVINGEQCTLC